MSLTKNQYARLMALFDKLQMTSSDFSAGGQHYDLINLLNEFGFYPYNSYDAIQLAEELLATKPR